jgi:RNA polymerase sigma factor (sigma-70 family)
MSVPHSELSDKELLGLMALDNKLAFNTLYYRYWDRALSLAAKKMNDIMEAENIVQDVFFSIWQRRHTLLISGELQNYLVVSIKYRVIKVLDKQRSQRMYEDHAISSFDLLDDSTQQYLAFDELYERLEIAIRSLPEQSRLIYRLNKEDGLSYKQIGNKLNLTEKAVGLHLVRIKKALRATLGGFLTITLL